MLLENTELVALAVVPFRSRPTTLLLLLLLVLTLTLGPARGPPGDASLPSASTPQNPGAHGGPQISC